MEEDLNLLAKPKLFHSLIVIISSISCLFIALFWIVIIVAEDQMELISLHHWLDTEANTYVQSVNDTNRSTIVPNVYEFDFYVGGENLPAWLSSYQKPGFYEHHLGPEDKHFLVRQYPSSTKLFYIVFKDNADDYLDSYESKLVLFSSALGAFILIVMVALGFYLVKIISTPLHKIQHKITQMDPVYPVFVVDAEYQEIAIIEQALLDSKKRIQEFFKREQEFSHFVAHEIRTPLMVLEGSAQTLISIESNDKLSAKASARILSASRKINLLTNTFLLLGKEHIDEHYYKSVDVALMLSNTINELRPTMQKRGLSIQTNMPEALSIGAPPDMLQVVINNLLKNALAYAAHETAIKPITVALEQRCLKVTNHYDASQIESGFGYGLIIIERICERMNWALLVSKNEDIFEAVIQF